MQGLALGGLAVAVAFGLWLAAMHVRMPPRRPERWVRFTHGVAGAVGFLATLAVLSAQGWKSSALVWDAVGLLGATLVSGLLVWRAGGWLGAQRGMVLMVHGAFAASGAAVIAGWLLD